MPVTVEKHGITFETTDPNLQPSVSATLEPKAASGYLNTDKNAPSVSQIEAKDGQSPRSPALDSLLNMVNFQTDSASLELYLAEIIQSTRDTENRIGKSRIDLLTNNKLAQLKEKQEKIAEAQRKFDEAEKLQVGSKFFSWVRFGLSLLTTAAGGFLIFTGVGAGVGICMIGLVAVSAISTLNEGVSLASGKGIAGHVASLAGASKKAAANWDFGASIALFALGFFLAAGVIAIPAAAGVATATVIEKFLSTSTKVSAAITTVISLVQTALNYRSSSVSADELDLRSVAKKYEAEIQQLDAYVQHATDSFIASNNKNNEIIESLIRSYSDVSNAMSRIRFAG